MAQTVSVIIGGLRVFVRAFVAALVVTLLSWTLVECAPGSTAERAALASRAIPTGDIEMPKNVRDSIVADVANKYGLDRSFGTRLLQRSWALTHLDFGSSWRDGTSVRETLFSRSGLASFVLCLASLALAAILACFAALASARSPKGISHRSVSAMSVLLLSVPLPWVAMMSVKSLSYGYPFSLLPTGGQSITAYLLPLLVMASVPAVVIWRHLSEELLKQANALWVLTARASGASESELWRRQVLKASVPSVLPLFPVLLAYLFGASVLVERVFAIDGIGELLARGADSNDAPVLIGVASAIALVISLATSIATLVARRIDPRRQR